MNKSPLLLIGTLGCLLLSTPALADGWKTTSLGKSALKTRPRGTPEGKPWVKLWKDTYPSNEAKKLDKKLSAKDENKTCNGLDDNNNGKIDEGCGMKSGGFQATLAWENHADLDIQVVYSPWDHSRHTFDHGKHRLTYGYGNEPIPEVFLGEGRNRTSFKLQGNLRGSCSCNARYVNGKMIEKREGCKEVSGALWAEPNEYVENAYFEGEKAPPGIYSISFYNHGTCPSRGQKQARATVGITVNGKTIGHYLSGDLGPQGFSFPIVKVYVPE